MLKDLSPSITTPRKTLCKCVWWAVSWDNCVGKGHGCWALSCHTTSYWLARHPSSGEESERLATEGPEQIPQTGTPGKRRREEGLKTLSC